MRSPGPRLARWTPWKSLTLVALAIVVGWLAVASLSGVLGHPAPGEADTLKGKLDLLASKMDQVSALFIGNSGTLKDVLPSLFDQELTASGCPQKSFNLADQSYSFPQFYALMKELLETRRTALKWVFIDESTVGDDDPIGEAEARTTLSGFPIRWEVRTESRSFISWHDWQSTRDLLGSLIESDLPLRRKLPLFAIHAKGFLQRLFDPGSATMRIRGFLRRYAEGRPKYFDLGEDGGENPAFYTGPSAGFGRMKKQYLAAVARLETHDPREQMPFGTPFKTLIHERLIELFKAHGIRTVLWVPPSMEPYQRVNAHAEIPVFDFNSPTRYPDLYSFDVRADFDHLNPTGAALLTRKLARAFADFTGCGGH
jgi:hypothetical protein